MDGRTTVQYFTISDTAKLIKLRTEHDVLFDCKTKGAKAAWSLILKEMGLVGVVTTEQLSKKWENMKRKYKELKCPAPGMEKEAAKGAVTWQWFSMLDKALGNQFPLPTVVTAAEDSSASLDGMDDRSTVQYSYTFTISDTTKLIKLRTEYDALFDGKTKGAKAAWSLILKEMGLEGVATTAQLSKKWENMKRKYKELKCPAPGMEKEAAKGAVTWHWFSMLDKALGNQFPLPTVVTAAEDSCASLSTKRVCLGQQGNDVLKLLPNTPLPDYMETEDTLSSDYSEREPDMDLETEMASLRRERLELEGEQAEVHRERLLLERERKLLERERTAMERDETQLGKDWATVKRDRAVLEQDMVRLEKDLASLERDKVAVAREREELSKDRENNIAHSEANSSTLEDRQKLRSLFEKLIEKF
ncbi:uncharacterized protein LOC134094069 [Sardina pilchardus]|uniref:uncharacterized protein LOC134094069 n=1 Tax=Sardina pilchardus TaxID=27697 RepID=UPI002E13F791